MLQVPQLELQVVGFPLLNICETHTMLIDRAFGLALNTGTCQYTTGIICTIPGCCAMMLPKSNGIAKVRWSRMMLKSNRQGQSSINDWRCCQTHMQGCCQNQESDGQVCCQSSHPMNEDVIMPLQQLTSRKRCQGRRWVICIYVTKVFCLMCCRSEGSTTLPT